MDTLHPETPLFANEAWTLTAAGLEHRNGYFIEREELGARRGDGLWSWPLQMAEKLWCAPRPFVEAFLRATLAFGVEADADLARSLAVVRDASASAASPQADALALGRLAERAVRASRKRVFEIEVERGPAEAPRRAA
jgi:hypothetical protein